MKRNYVVYHYYYGYYHCVLNSLLVKCLKYLFFHSSVHINDIFFYRYRFGFPKGFSASVAKEWFDRRRVSIRPWASFVDQRKFSKPRNFGEMCQRVVKNVEIYNSNYTFIFLGLILYCM